MGLPGFLGENRQIRSSYAEVYHRGSPDIGPGGFSGERGVLLGNLKKKLPTDFDDIRLKRCVKSQSILH